MFVTLQMRMNVISHFNSTLPKRSQMSRLPSKAPASKFALMLVPQRTPSTTQHMRPSVLKKQYPIKPTNVKLRPYGEDNPAPIPLIGSFFGLINTPFRQTGLTKFLVLKARNAGCRLSHETTTWLGMLHTAASTTTEHPPLHGEYQHLLQKFPPVFSGIEHVTGPTPWMSPLVIVDKPNGDGRLCVNMCKPNEALCRTHHPYPTSEEILQDLNGSKFFSKIDLKECYHQIELTESSGHLTTFKTLAGLHRYETSAIWSISRLRSMPSCNWTGPRGMP